MKIEKIMEMDADDRRILSILQDNPETSHSQIAKTINKSQPAVGARILKLERKKLLATQYGLDISKTKDIILATVSMYVKDAPKLLKRVIHCPYVVNAFSMTGLSNVMIWLMGSNIEKIEEIIDVHFRAKPDIKNLHISIITESILPLVLPIDFRMEYHDKLECKNECIEMVYDIEEDDIIEEEYVPASVGGELDKIFGIDDDDKRIIMYLQSEPDITHTEIARRIGKSQPAIGARVVKLKKKGFLKMQKGVNFSNVNGLELVRVAISTHDLDAVKEKLNSCNMVLASFRGTGDKSLVAFVAGPSVIEINNFLDNCFRREDVIDEMETSLVIKVMKDLILPYNFQVEFNEESGCAGCRYSPAIAESDIQEVISQYALARE